jgi:hypothetical protein
MTLTATFTVKHFKFIVYSSGKFGLDYFLERKQLFSKPNPAAGSVSGSKIFLPGMLIPTT